MKNNKYNRATQGWKWSNRFRELQAAHTWGCPSPLHFDLLPKNTRIDIVAWYEAQWRIEAINIYERLEEQEREYQKNLHRK